MIYNIPEKSDNNIVPVFVIIPDAFTEQEVEHGFYVDHVPKAYTPEGMYAVLMWKKDTNELFYKYETLPEIPPITPTPNLADEVAAIKTTVDEILTVIIPSMMS